MPDFLDSYIEELKSKSGRIKLECSGKSSKIETELERAFRRFWIAQDLPNNSPSEFSVFAIDSSSQYIATSNGGIFYALDPSVSEGSELLDIYA